MLWTVDFWFARPCCCYDNIALRSSPILYANLSLLFSTITYLSRSAGRQRTDKSIMQRKSRRTDISRLLRIVRRLLNLVYGVQQLCFWYCSHKASYIVSVYHCFSPAKHVYLKAFGIIKFSAYLIKFRYVAI